MTNLEVWKDIPNYPGYRVSNYGNVTSKKVNRLSQHDNGRGYPYVSLCRPKHKRPIAVHKLVANAFLNNPKNYKEVNHKDGDKWNNRVKNLEWCDHAMNIRHAYKVGLLKRGEDRANSILRERDVIAILTLHRANPKINQSELGRKYKVSGARINYIIHGKKWKHVFERFHSKEGYSLPRNQKI